MTGKGGARPGAGRKPKAINRIIHANPIQVAEATISERLPWLVGKMLELADGVYRERTMPDGVTKVVYQERPDRQAITDLLDRIMGKAVQPISLVDKVREIAAAQGLSDEETAEAVAEAERITKASGRARG